MRRIISALQLLGEMLLDANHPLQALQAFEAALKVEPGRFLSLYGAAHAAELSRDRTKAKSYYAQLVAQTTSADVEQRPGLKLARAYLENR